MTKLFMNLFEEAVINHCKESGYDSHEDRVEFYDGKYCYVILDKHGIVGYDLIYDKLDKIWFVDNKEFGEKQISDADAYCLARNFLNDEGAQMADDLVCCY